MVLRLKVNSCPPCMWMWGGFLYTLYTLFIYLLYLNRRQNAIFIADLMISKSEKIFLFRMYFWKKSCKLQKLFLTFAPACVVSSVFYFKNCWAWRDLRPFFLSKAPPRGQGQGTDHQHRSSSRVPILVVRVWCVESSVYVRKKSKNFQKKQLVERKAYLVAFLTHYF